MSNNISEEYWGEDETTPLIVTAFHGGSAGKQIQITLPDMADFTVLKPHQVRDLVAMLSQWLDKL